MFLLVFSSYCKNYQNIVDENTNLSSGTSGGQISEMGLIGSKLRC